MSTASGRYDISPPCTACLYLGEHGQLHQAGALRLPHHNVQVLHGLPSCTLDQVIQHCKARQPQRGPHCSMHIVVADNTTAAACFHSNRNKEVPCTNCKVRHACSRCKPNCSLQIVVADNTTAAATYCRKSEQRGTWTICKLQHVCAHQGHSTLHNRDQFQLEAMAWYIA